VAAAVKKPLETRERLILASASPRRRELLAGLGLAFEVMEANIEEKPLPGEGPEEFALRAACDKANAVCRRQGSAWVLGADTVVVHENRLLGKPADSGEALAVLLSLAGRSHLVHTGFCLEHRERNVAVRRLVTTEVCFFSFDKAIAAAYVASGEPLDKAGAYGIQGIGGFLVKKISGSCSNVIGLPLAEVVEELLRYEVVQPRQ
jgi:septum formation protein